MEGFKYNKMLLEDSSSSKVQDGMELIMLNRGKL